MGEEYNGINSSMFKSGTSNNMFDSNANGLGRIDFSQYYKNPMNTSGSGSTASAEDNVALDYRKLMNENIKSQTDMNKQNILNATGADAPKWADVQGVGGTFDWLTANRGGGSNYLNTGLGAISAGVNLWEAYNKNKYQGKMADIADRAQGLQDRQQNLYEDQIKKQEAKQAKAQKAYDDAQNLRM